MLTVAYLANQFPAPVEPYVGEEIEELRRRGVRVISGSVRLPDFKMRMRASVPSGPEICLQPLGALTVLRALGLIGRRWKRVADLLAISFCRGEETFQRRLKALLHTLLGACYAVRLQSKGVDHIHVHHGYFGSWVAMVAARLLGVSYSLTLHGSDLLINGSYLDAKLGDCAFCVTISEYNRRYIREHFPAIDMGKILVSRLGVEIRGPTESPGGVVHAERCAFTMLTVGRLHAVKDHAFLIRACGRLRDRGLDFECVIAGEGPERRKLDQLIREERLQDRVRLLGHVDRPLMDSLYQRADVVVLTSRSEGIPLVLMEAMARGRIALAPAITGIPEIVIGGRTGFLYKPGALDDFVARILFLQALIGSEDGTAVSRLDWIRHAARAQIVHNFNRRKNLSQFGDQFLRRIAPQDLTSRFSEPPKPPYPDWSPPHEDLVLQQV